MNTLLDTLARGPALADGAVGSYLFEQTGRLSEPRHVYEALNVDDPDVISQLHWAYLQAGARCLTTNTFSANASHLDRLGEGHRLVELNRAGARLARQAVTAFRNETQHTQTPCFVIGSLGPPAAGTKTAAELRSTYTPQVETLLAEGVDALLLETFTDQEQVAALLDVIREIDGKVVRIVQMRLRQSGVDAVWEQDPVAFVQTVADRGADVVGVNCCAPWEATAFVEAVRDVDAVRGGRVQLSAMPNAGGSQRIGHRYLTQVNAEYMGRWARTLAQQGVRLLGGCCGVHPGHIREMHNYLGGHQADRPPEVTVTDQALTPADDARKQANGPFSDKLKTDRFVVSVEMLPARGTAPKALQAKVDFIAELARSGAADALDVTDGSRGIPLMPPGDFMTAARQRLNWTAQTGDGLEFIAHFTARDLNLMGVQSRMIGYWTLGIRNVLFITGDPPKMSPTYPRSSAVFDLDSAELIRYTHTCLNAGVDFGGRRLGRHPDPRTAFTIGTGFEPEALDLKHELTKLERKVNHGVDYLMTQPAFRFKPLDTLEPFRQRVSILIGVMVLTGKDHALRVGQTPGVVIPKEIYQRLEAYDQPADQAKAGRDIAIEQVRRVRADGWSGLYLMSPASHHPVIEVLEAGLGEGPAAAQPV